jgi:hypothetical protein
MRLKLIITQKNLNDFLVISRKLKHSCQIDEGRSGLLCCSVSNRITPEKRFPKRLWCLKIRKYWVSGTSKVLNVCPNGLQSICECDIVLWAKSTIFLSSPEKRYPKTAPRWNWTCYIPHNTDRNMSSEIYRAYTQKPHTFSFTRKSIRGTRSAVLAFPRIKLWMASRTTSPRLLSRVPGNKYWPLIGRADRWSAPAKEVVTSETGRFTSFCFGKLSIPILRNDYQPLSLSTKLIDNILCDSIIERFYANQSSWALCTYRNIVKDINFYFKDIYNTKLQFRLRFRF